VKYAVENDYYLVFETSHFNNFAIVEAMWEDDMPLGIGGIPAALPMLLLASAFVCAAGCTAGLLYKKSKASR